MTKKYRDILNKNQKDSFYTYVSKNNLADTAANANAEAAVKKKLSDSNYGALAENLAVRGLSGSGFEDYIKSEVKRAAEAQRAAAVSLSAENQARARSDYEKYVSDYDKLQGKISDAVLKHFSDGERFSLDEAYRYAISRGLSEERAYYTAAAAVRASSEAAVKRIVEFAEKNHLTAKQTRRFARNSGLDERYVKQIYEAMSVLSDEERMRYSSMGANDYINYIKTMKG